ncbi:hypothetical protein HMPREF9727_00939 [Treponema denticola MYR-T]|uniref:Uncharacterized protein n=1 Tax=Treponema denticola H1-T TaxID=999431 RepID=M2CA90_TREDN|nr:hypothetical protein HMPREF9727_00939 [Treponema denticola MYR-T]EMB31254.1 hypothetical protein HMPREF9725_01303 [Treponema denticola H1-T]
MFYQKYGSQIFRNTKNKQLSSYIYIYNRKPAVYLNIPIIFISHTTDYTQAKENLYGNKYYY